jgi:drug/metabolite transporter (DMT)-like permease
VPLSALLLALTAAFTHAAWNLLVARERDPMAATAVALLTSEILLAPVAIARWDLDADAWPFVVASGALELVYFLLLTTGYQRGEMSVVYTLARGVAPVIVLVVGATTLGQATGAADVLGVSLVVAGVLLVRGLRAPADRASVVFGLLTAVAIAGYTLVDDRGIEHAGAATYLWLILLPPAVLMPLGLRRRVRPALTWRAPLVGVGGLVTYALVLLALERADAAPVSAVRETSVVVGVALAALFLRERVTVARAAGAVFVALGIGALSL